MLEIVIISGASELMPQLRYRLSREGLSINGIGNLTIAAKEEISKLRMKNFDVQDMMREINAVLEKYSESKKKS